MSNPAESYENYIVPALFDPWARDLRSRVSLHEGNRVVDIASGTGIVARRIAQARPAPGPVTGIDPNPSLLAIARAAAEREGVKVEFHEGRAEGLPFADGSFDRAFCQQGAQFFADRKAGFTEMARVLNPGGEVAVSTWQSIDRHEFFQALHQCMQRHLGTPAAAAPFGLSDPEELGALLSAAGFQEVQVTQERKISHYPDPDRFLTETLDALLAVVASMLDIGEEELREGASAIVSDLKEPLDAFTEDDHVVLSWHANIATARR